MFNNGSDNNEQTEHSWSQLCTEGESPRFFLRSSNFRSFHDKIVTPSTPFTNSCFRKYAKHDSTQKAVLRRKRYTMRRIKQTIQFIRSSSSKFCSTIVNGTTQRQQFTPGERGNRIILRAPSTTSRIQIHSIHQLLICVKMSVLF